MGIPARPHRGDDSDGRLVRRVLLGDKEAYSTLVVRHQAGLFRYACGLGVPPDPAGDLVQEAFLSAFDRLATLHDPDRFEMWLFRILRNDVFDYLKNIRRRSVNVDRLPLPDPAPGPEAGALSSDLRTRLDAGLGKLTDELREAFLLKHLEGLSYQEIAEVTDVSVSALKMRVMRARDVLREELTRRGISRGDVTPTASRSSVLRRAST